jgi:hypothetical protein
MFRFFRFYAIGNTQHYPSSLKLDEEQDVVCRQASPREHLHGKEVGSREYGYVRSNELFVSFR